MDWNWLPKNSGVPNLALCWWVQPSKTCLSTHKRVIIVSASDINLKQEKKRKKWKEKVLEGHFSCYIIFFSCIKERDWYCVGQDSIEVEWDEESLEYSLGIKFWWTRELQLGSSSLRSPTEKHNTDAIWPSRLWDIVCALNICTLNGNKAVSAFHMEA